MSKIIVATGSRDWRDVRTIETVLNDLIDEFGHGLTLRQGCGSGADAIVRAVADYYNYNIEDFWPDYMNFDFATANKLRNIVMLDAPPTANLVIAFPTRSSRGTWHTINEARKRGIEVRNYGAE